MSSSADRKYSGARAVPVVMVLLICCTAAVCARRGVPAARNKSIRSANLKVYCMRITIIEGIKVEIVESFSAEDTAFGAANARVLYQWFFSATAVPVRTKGCSLARGMGEARDGDSAGSFGSTL